MFCRAGEQKGGTYFPRAQVKKTDFMAEPRPWQGASPMIQQHKGGTTQVIIWALENMSGGGNETTREDHRLFFRLQAMEKRLFPE